MSLDNGAQLILQTERPSGDFDCIGYTGLQVTYPAVIVLSRADTTIALGDLDALKTALISRLQFLYPNLEQVEMNCGGNLNDPSGCHAQKQSDCQKLLVLIGDSSQALLVKPSHQPWIVGSPMHRVLTVFPLVARRGVSKLLAPQFALPNIHFWSQSIDEVLSSILAISGLTVENPRIFISYRQTDSAAFAIQLFDALSHAGFDTFLDHFRISPGVNFQSRLTQELGDKSMMLLIESQHILDSQWTMYEINTAKTCSLGIFALHVPGGVMAPGIDAGVRQTLADGDFVGETFNETAQLKKAVLDNIIQRVRAEHDNALVKRRRILYDSLDGALDTNGVNLEPTSTSGMAIAQGKNQTKYVVWLTPRPPELIDFHGVHSHAAPPVRGVVVGLSRLMEPARLEQTNWLASISQLRMVDEGMIRIAAQEMAQGTL